MADAPEPPDAVSIPSVEERITVAPKGRRLVGDEPVRAALAFVFTLIFLLTILLSFFHLGDRDWQKTKDWLTALLPAETALIGSATGFYFGSRSKE